MSGQRVEFVYPAPDGERFAPGAFDGRIGQPVTVSRQVTEHYSAVLADAVLREAEVAEDGLSVRVVVELPDTVAGRTVPL